MTSKKKPADDVDASQKTWEAEASLIKAVAHPLRLSILETLDQGSKCVKDLNMLVPVPQPQLSQHIAALRKAELVACHSDGPLRCYYVLRPNLVRKLISLLRQDHPPQYRPRDKVKKEAKSGRN